MSERSAIVKVFSDVLVNITLSQRAGNFAGILTGKLKNLVKGKNIPTPAPRKHNDKHIWLNYLWMVKAIRDNTSSNHEYFSQTHADNLSIFDDYSIKIDDDIAVVIDVLIMAIIEASKILRSKEYQCLTKDQVGCVGSKDYTPHKFEPDWEVIISRLLLGSTMKGIIAEGVASGGVSEVSDLFQGLTFTQCVTSIGGSGEEGALDWGDNDELTSAADEMSSAPPAKVVTDPLSGEMVRYIMEHQGASEAVARETVMATVVSEYFRDKNRLEKFLKDHEKSVPSKVARDDGWKLDSILGELKAIREDINHKLRVDILPGPSVLSETPQVIKTVNVLANKSQGSLQAAGPSKQGSSDKIDWDSFFN